jgi:hypothetical protein
LGGVVNVTNWWALVIGRSELEAAAAGATGVGHAKDYMTSLGIHIGGGPAAVWGA